MKILAVMQRSTAVWFWFVFSWGLYLSKDMHGFWLVYALLGSLFALVVGSWYWNEAEEYLKRGGKND